jgi:hypothetical protein
MGDGKRYIKTGRKYLAVSVDFFYNLRNVLVLYG